MELRAELRRPAVVVIADTFYPGWEARIDGEEASILVANGTWKGVLAWNTQKQIVELPNSLKYAMRHDRIFFDPSPKVKQAFHSYMVDEKSVQSAGGIVADRGKVVAVDNVSGHYVPGWRLLSQAVEYIGPDR